MKTSGYYKRAFAELEKAGVPKWYIRLYALSGLIYFARIYFYRNVYNVETQDGWYTTNAIAITAPLATEADKNRKCYGELINLGFPTWEEYRGLFDGDEYDNTAEFMDAYDRHLEGWQKASIEFKELGYEA